MRAYCDICEKNVETKIIEKKEIFKVCGEDIAVDSKVLLCEHCGEELFCEELDSETLKNAYNEYRRKHSLLFPEEIKSIREQYGLSQRGFAKLLNWGDKTIYRYENGAIQDNAHNSLMLFLREPENMRSYLSNNKNAINQKQLSQLQETIDSLEQGMTRRKGIKFLELYFSNSPSIENGFKGFDYDKVCAMVLFFAHKCAGLLKTKLMKLLNYSDMVFYKENGISMSGRMYAHLPYGPVPDNSDILIGKMEADQIIRIEVIYENGYEKHQVLPECEVAEGSFSDAEKRVLERVYERFKDFGSVEISEYSHKEKGYASTKTGDIISYAYANDITLD